MKLFAFIAGFILLNVFLAWSISFVLEKERAPYISILAKQVVIDKDTLTIVDYSIIAQRVYLSNGSSCSPDFAVRKMIKPLP